MLNYCNNMKYPTHVILDVQTRTSSTEHSSWQGEFARVTSTSISKRLSNGPTSNLSFNQQASSPNTGILSRNIVNHRSSTFLVFDIHFLRKEKLYTKLKYSRCPQYDIVSGGFAALLAGFIGFLISEKFGIELVDSGDFYNAFMYIVFASFSVRPLIRCYSEDNTLYSPISPKHLIMFTRDVLVLLLRAASNYLYLLLHAVNTTLNSIFNSTPVHQILALALNFFTNRK
jgi:hypothetical protein